MPPVRHQNIRRRNASRVYNFRNNETEEERRQPLEANRMRISQARSTTAPEEPLPSGSDERRQNRRSNVLITYERLAFGCHPTVAYAGDKSVDFETVNKICQYCSALRFGLKPTGLCSANGKVQLPF